MKKRLGLWIAALCLVGLAVRFGSLPDAATDSGPARAVGDAGPTSTDRPGEDPRGVREPLGARRNAVEPGGSPAESTPPRATDETAGVESVLLSVTCPVGLDASPSMLFELGHSGASEALARTSFTPLHPDSFPGFSENRVGRFPAGEYWWTLRCDRFGFVLASGTIALSGADAARRVDLPVVSADDLGSLRIVTHVSARPQLVGEEYRISDAVRGEEILTMVAPYSGRERRFESTLEGVPSGIYEVRSAQLGESRFVTVTERADARVEFRAP